MKDDRSAPGQTEGLEGAWRTSRGRRVEWALIVYSVVASSFGAALFARGMPGLEGAPFWRLVVWQGPSYLAWAVLLPVIAWVGGRRRSPGALQSVVRYGVAGLVLIPLHALFASWWFAYAHPAETIAITGRVLVDGLLERVPIDLLMYCAIVGTLYARDYALRFGEEKARAERLERELLATELEVLKTRLRPHFLFNTLQSITVLVKREPEVAIRMTKDLAALLRRSLQTAGRPLVSLETEIELLEQYVAIESTRFSHRLTVAFDVEPGARACLIPDLLLQPLVENAIHHGVSPRTAGGSVWVKGRVDGSRLRIEVGDDGVGMPEAGAVDGVGLGVTRSRLEGFYGADHVFSVARRPGGGTVVSVELPARQGPAVEAE